MKKKLSLIIIPSGIVLLALYGAAYLLSLKKVSFVLEKTVESVSIYTSNKHETKQITSSREVTLKKGDYYAIPRGKDILNKPINFTVKNEAITVTINPYYSDEYLQKLVKSELPSISAAIEAKYPSLHPKYSLTNGTLYAYGDWFGGLLEPKVSDTRDRRDPYRVVLHKVDGKWQVVRRPEYILTSSRYKEVPIDILRAINKIAR